MKKSIGYVTFSSLFLLFMTFGAQAQTHNCGPGWYWDESMQMCMPGTDPHAPQAKKTTLSFHLNQFLVGGVTGGDRGRSALYAPDMWMLDLTHKLTPKNQLKVEWMGDADLLLANPDHRASPELYQTGEADQNGKPYVDAQHPHSTPIMGLTFSDILLLNPEGDHKLTFFFAPRGEATAGPTAFMHRSSATGNPYAPLSHHLQDSFHITSTVLSGSIQDLRNELEVSTFSGRVPSPTKVDLDMHPFDSYAFRYTRQLNSVFKAGASFAHVLETNPVQVSQTNEPNREDHYSAWLTATAPVGKGTLNLDTIWGIVDDRTENQTLNGFLEEFSYQLGKNNFFGRMEVLQRTPEQLQITVTNGDNSAQWVKAVTLGYERQLIKKGMWNVFGGGSVTQAWSPEAFAATYGKHPGGFEVHLRTSFMKATKANDPNPSVNLEPTYSSIFKNIILPKCASCHTTTIGDGDGLEKVNMDNYETLVHPTELSPAIDIANPKESKILKALISGKMPSAMDGMPKPEPLSLMEIQTISDWIQAGAQNN